MNSARREVADALGVDPSGLYFTSGGTEANNLAVIGGALAKKRRGNRSSSRFRGVSRVYSESEVHVVGVGVMPHKAA